MKKREKKEGTFSVKVNIPTFKNILKENVYILGMVLILAFVLHQISAGMTLVWNAIL